MIKPSELLHASENYKYFIFYGTEKLPKSIYIQKLGKNSYCEIDLGSIDFEKCTIEGRPDLYDYSKGISSILLKSNANFIAHILDKYSRVKRFYQKDDTTLYICLELKEK